MISAKEEKALAVVSRLHAGGFRAFFAGGCVRDRVLGAPVKDYDIATDARPEVVQQMFEHTVPVGARFGVVMVVIEGDPFEVVTFRADAPYVDGRRPSAVRFGTIEEDAKRRDLTICGMYYDTRTSRVVDLVGGLRDLRAGVIRAIGNPYERFEEDRLRILRAVRFAARLGFSIDSTTWDAIKRAAPAVVTISAERVGEELVRMMTEGGAARGMDILLDSGLMNVLMPEMTETVGCRQPENFHPEGDVYTHLRAAVSMLDPGCSETLAFGALLHDIAKPRCRAEQDGKITFYGHTEQGAEMAAAIMARLRRSRFVQERVAYLAKNHLRVCSAPRMRPATLKRMLREDGFEELLELARLDALASSSYLGYYHFCRRAMAEMGGEVMRPARLIGGADLIAMGFSPGPAFKTILKEVEDQQLDGVLKTHEDALEYVRSHFGQPQART